jgi:hypothetical protein
VLQSRGIQLPGHTFINPRSASVEHMHGWAGLPTAAKVAIIAGAAATGIGAAGALGAFGGAAGAGAGAGGAGAAGATGGILPTLTAVSGLPAGLGAGGVGAVGLGGGGLASGLLTNAGIGAAESKLQGGSWKDALIGGGLGAATGGLGGGTVAGGGYKAALTAMLKDPSTYLSLAGDVGSVLGKQEAGKAAGKVQQANVNSDADRTAVALYQAQQNAQTQAAQTDLQRKGFESQNRGSSAKQALIGSLLGGGVTPTSVGPGGASGGLLRSLNANPDALEALKTLGSQGRTAQTTPLAFEGGNQITAPKLTPVPQVDQGGVLSTLARVSELLGAASPYLQPQKEQPRLQVPAMPYQSGLQGQLPGERYV